MDESLAGALPAIKDSKAHHHSTSEEQVVMIATLDGMILVAALQLHAPAQAVIELGVQSQLGRQGVVLRIIEGGCQLDRLLE